MLPKTYRQKPHPKIAEKRDKIDTPNIHVHIYMMFTVMS
jgi:hypothetical protein